MWTVARVLNYLSYSRVCPFEIDPMRWAAMVRCIEINYK